MILLRIDTLALLRPCQVAFPSSREICNRCLLNVVLANRPVYLLSYVEIISCYI